MLRASGAGRIVAVEPSAHRAPVAHAVGADVVVTPDEWAAQRTELMPGGADVVVDAVGERAAAGDRGSGHGRPGRHVRDERERPPEVHQVEIVEKGLAILGSYISNFTFPAAIRLVESGRLNLAPMITATIPLEDTVAGIARIRSGEAVKIVIKP